MTLKIGSKYRSVGMSREIEGTLLTVFLDRTGQLQTVIDLGIKGGFWDTPETTFVRYFVVHSQNLRLVDDG